MAKYYEVGVRGIAAATGAAYATLHTGAGQRAKIREIGIALSAATLSSIGLGRPANTPVATTSALGQALDPNDVAATVNADTVWSTAPTAPSVFVRRFVLPAVAGAGLIWTFPADAPLVLNVSSWLVLWNFGASTAAAPDLYVKWEE